MNGWHRLWILLAVVYLVVIAAIAVGKIASISPRADASTLRYVSDSTLRALDSAGDAFDILEVEGMEIKVSSKLPQEEKVRIAKEIYGAALKNVRTQRREAALIYSALWFVPCLSVFLLGHGIAWVICGFRKKEPNQPPQRNAGSRPSAADSPAAETPSSPGPRG